MTRRILISVLVLPFLLTACGDDDSTGAGSGDSSGQESERLSPEQEAVREVLVQSFLDPSCELLTEEYLVAKALYSETAEKACDEHQQTWVEPQYDEDDINVSDIEIIGDVATAIIGSDNTNITTVYELKQIDGSWLVSCEDFTCDHLGEPTGVPTGTPSPEVS